jgi:four helix bundle protein
MSPVEMKERTKAFAVRIVKLVQTLPRSEEARIIGRQLLRAGTSVGANYRAVCRARSRAEFAAKMGIVMEEADETAFWLELLIAIEIMPAHRLNDLIRETEELLAIGGASIRTVKIRIKTNDKSRITKRIDIPAHIPSRVNEQWINQKHPTRTIPDHTPSRANEQ